MLLKSFRVEQVSTESEDDLRESLREKGKMEKK